MENTGPQFNRELYKSEESEIFQNLYASFNNSSLSLAYKLQAFPLFVRRQDIAYFMAKYEIFKQILNTNGSIVECGVFVGGGIMTWLHCSSILEPYNHTRKIIGFDLNEVSPGTNEYSDNTDTAAEWDANVGARLLYKLCGWVLQS